MKHRKYAFITVFLCVCSYGLAQDERDTKQHPELTKVVQSWANKISGELWHFGEMVTRKDEVKNSFKDTSIVYEDGETLLNDIHERISNMMRQKVDAVRRIMDIAEQAAQAQKEEDIDFNFQFYNAKNLTNSVPNITGSDEYEIQDLAATQDLRYDESLVENSQVEQNYQSIYRSANLNRYQRDQESNNKDEFDVADTETSDEGLEKDPQASQAQIDKSRLPLYRNRHFYNIPVNTNYSAVHVPSNVYERSKDVIAGIKWSEELDKTFRNNYKVDPTLSWQYFGSSTGFMRQFPAMIWSQEPVDLFDCRTRSWYIEAASSPKDILILVDRSGSMTGMRREIARHVVHNLLDTLGNNDYINIYTFSNTTDPLVPCFDNKLVQANLANIRVFKESMTDFKTEQIANLSLALSTAFEILQAYRESKLGANCNQAIMLVTDNSQDNYKEVFEKYNWDNLPIVTVRVFTYLIGREVSDTRNVKWMACANQGYYVHLSTYAEVREEVLHYIPVMARPMVLNGNQKPNPSWSPVYADVTDPKLTNWLWVNRQRNMQRERYLMFSKYKDLMSPYEIDKMFVHQQKMKQDVYGDTQTYHLMTSVSLPVYDKKPRQNITEKQQVNEAVWITVTREERVANLLGVAGTDVPIEYIKRHMLPYRLGVNGYGFIVTNNGYILTHPDLRPVYKGILKPAYNKVDMMEVEIVDDDTLPREFGDEIRELRHKIVMQKKGNITMRVKSHLDDMTRIHISNRNYYYMGINNTPFSLVIALPHRYGFNRAQHPVENDIHRIRSNDKGQHTLTQFFTGNWTIHPDWHYCRYLDEKHYFETAEEEFLHFLKKMEGPGWKWSRECDRKLIAKVVADAKITVWFSENITTTTKEDKGAQLIKDHGIVVAFMATHSGLTRWQNFPQNIDNNLHEKHFHNIHNKAIDEVWYRRAIDHSYVDPGIYVYSVPHEAGEANNTLVTVSSGVFKEDGGRKAPVAVVGYQFYHASFYNFFKKITINCGDMQKACKKTCDSEELHCLMLDDGGYVIVSDNIQETGFFFGKLRPDIMSSLIDEGIYSAHRMYDYQGLCPVKEDSESSSSKLLTPYFYFLAILDYILSTAVSFTEAITGNMYYDPAMFQMDNNQFEEPIDHGDHVVSDHDDHEGETGHEPDYDHEGHEQGGDKAFDESATMPKTKPEPCDNSFYLYSLIHYTTRNESASGYNKTMGNCSRPFVVQRVSGSNMILLVINNLCQEQKDRFPPSPDPEEYVYNASLPCYVNQSPPLPRRLYMTCVNRTANESEIKLCGSGNNISPHNLVILINFYLVFRLFFSVH
ncbi:voltage-dependent calcium channel subunit alpha-2/delta-3 isoform X2 [Anthonomus grandis grandis]|uniref:voltage-dependent calcium channel subunit alpha-2/delta-3 isoform X2 n=1 Tax=Anthonomus grandis grandis TaxID=2921223 RepID=UPI0021669276|nr:voltage-dependent calcium channel subunit alpha-2/delta-3 isoform X2 [Anthonomus grandis grandis]